MSELRDELQRARDAYASARYPGDLSADVTVTRAGAALRWLALGVAQSAIAAAIILSWVLLRGPDEATNSVPITLTLPAADEPRPMSLEMPPMPALPGGIGFTLPAMPSIPSLDELEQSGEAQSTTQEAV